MKLPAILESKKGQAFVLGLVTLVCKQLLDLPEETTTQIIGLVGVYVLGQSVVDHKKESVKAAQEEPKPPQP